MIATGIADDLLSTVVMTCPAPKLLALAMNTHMWENPIVVANVEKLLRLGYRFVAVGQGRLACGASGAGRIAEPDDVVIAVESCLNEAHGATRIGGVVGLRAGQGRPDPG